MTGAGSATVSRAVEDSFMTLPGSPIWRQPGENIQVGTASLERALQRARQPDDPRPDGSREGNQEGALNVTYAMTDTDFHELVFPASGPVGLARSAMLAPTATYYLAAETLPGTQERFAVGAATESLSMSYTQGEDFTIDETIIYADEYDADDAGAPDVPSTIEQPSKSDIVRWHGIDFQIDSVSVEELQSLSVDISGMARFRRGQQLEPTAAVVGAYEPSLTVEATLRDGTQRELAYGSAGATTTQDTIDETPATLTVDNPGGTLATYNLAGLQPTTFDWADLVAADSDITDPTDYHVRNVEVA
jgi:hypothetical protein